MKKNCFLLAFLFLLIMVSCQPNNEKKAMALIDNYMKGYLADYESYKPINVKIDTAYNNPVYDKDIIAIVKRINNNQKNIEELELKIELSNYDVKKARSSMAIYNSAYTREFYNLAVEEYNEATAKVNKLKIDKEKIESNVNELLVELKEKLSEMGDGVCGWLATVNYKCKNRLGTEIPTQSAFVINDDFSKIQTVIHEEDLMELIEICEDISRILDVEFEF